MSECLKDLPWMWIILGVVLLFWLVVEFVGRLVDAQIHTMLAVKELQERSSRQAVVAGGGGGSGWGGMGGCTTAAGDSGPGGSSSYRAPEGNS